MFTLRPQRCPQNFTHSRSLLSFNSILLLFGSPVPTCSQFLHVLSALIDNCSGMLAAVSTFATSALKALHAIGAPSGKYLTASGGYNLRLRAPELPSDLKPQLSHSHVFHGRRALRRCLLQIPPREFCRPDHWFHDLDHVGRCGTTGPSLCSTRLLSIYGITVLQTFIYFKTYPEDRKYLKLMVRNAC